MIPAVVRISILQPFHRGIPHERAEFAWTPAALTGKSTIVEISAANNAALIAKSGPAGWMNHRHGVAGGVSHIQLQPVHITLETEKIRRD